MRTLSRLLRRSEHGLLGLANNGTLFLTVLWGVTSLMPLHVVAPAALRVLVLVSVFGGALLLNFSRYQRSSDSLPARLKVRCAMSCIVGQQCTCTFALDTACLFFRCFGRLAHTNMAVYRRARRGECLRV
jgi:hypothetical protein